MELTHHFPRALGTIVTPGLLPSKTIILPDEFLEAAGSWAARSTFFRKALNKGGPDSGSFLVVPAREKQQMGMYSVLKFSPTLVWPNHRPVCINRKMSPHLTKQQWWMRKESNCFCHLQSKPDGPFLPPFILGKKGVLIPNKSVWKKDRFFQSSPGLQESDSREGLSD